MLALAAPLRPSRGLRGRLDWRDDDDFLLVGRDLAHRLAGADRPDVEAGTRVLRNLPDTPDPLALAKAAVEDPMSAVVALRPGHFAAVLAIAAAHREPAHGIGTA